MRTMDRYVFGLDACYGLNYGLKLVKNKGKVWIPSKKDSFLYKIHLAKIIKQNSYSAYWSITNYQNSNHIIFI